MRDRMDERYDMVRTACDGRYRYIRNYMPHRPWGAYSSFEWIAKGYQSWDEARIAGTLTPEQSRFFGRKPFEELYDLEADPYQLTNLANDAQQAATLARFRKALDAHMLAIRDNGFLPEGEPGEGYEATRSEAAYPLRRIMQGASVAARGEARNARRLAALLRNRNAVIRYWAATGLVVLGEAALPAKAALAETVARDASPAVRIAAAEALCNIGDPGIALAVLEQSVASGKPFQQRLMALNALDALDERARPALPSIKAIVDDENDYVIRAARYLVAVLEGNFRPAMPTGRPRAAGAPAGN